MPEKVTVGVVSHWLYASHVVNQPKLIRGQWPKEWRIAPRLHRSMAKFTIKGKYKGFPFSTPSVGPGADPGVQAVSPQETVSHPPGGRLPLLSARPAVTSPASEHHRPLAGTNLYCLVTEAHRYEQLAQGCYAALPRVGFEPATY